MSKKILIFLAVVMLVSTLGFAAQKAGDTGTLGNDQWRIRSDGRIESEAGYKYSYIPTSYVSATAIYAGGIGQPLTCTGIENASATASVIETGAAEGAVAMFDDADITLMTVKLPDTYVYTGVAADLQLSFDLSEAATYTNATGTDSLELAIYHYGQTRTALLSQNISMSGTARTYTTAVSLGDLVSSCDDTLIVSISPDSNSDDVICYGARLKTKAGVDIQ